MGSENLKVGDRLQDCDPRCAHRRGTITSIGPLHCSVDWVTSKTVVSNKRIHAKGIRSGYRLLRGDSNG